MTTPRFFAPAGRYEWLNYGAYVGALSGSVKDGVGGGTFSLNTGAYASETIRGALLSIPDSQWDAAYSIGMTYRQVLFRIVFPQALRVALPPLSNSFIGLVKDTSLASSITIVEMFMVSQQIASNNYQPLLMYSIVAAIYALFCTVLSILQHYLEKWTSRYVDAVGE